MARIASSIRTVTIAGQTFKASRRTIWHLRWTIWLLALRHPKARLVIYQPCYHGGYARSSGTHDYDCVFDVWINGLTPWRAQRFLRKRGWGAWFRHTGIWAPRSAWHIHMISLPSGLPANPTPAQVGAAYARLGLKVGKYIDGGYTSTGRTCASSQVDDYYAHALGLAGQHRAGEDRSWFPDNINRTVFHRSLWFRRAA
jgi:hypothetical protein